MDKLHSVRLVIDTNQGPSQIRLLHGVNRGPIDRRWMLDFSDQFRQVQIPSVRLHDCPLSLMDVVDLHYIFPDPKADPDNPQNYHFELTDDYLYEIREVGAEIYFRLGESIEHQPRKAYNRSDRWSANTLARVCVNIVRHYNEGWKNGFHWGIKHWEFWNEPDLGNKCWSGTNQEFFAFYRAVSIAIKNYDSSLLVGGPSFANPKNESYPLQKFLSECVEQAVPLDFLSWHRYFDSWDDISANANFVRETLDSMGLNNTESHLTEWAFLPRVGDGDTVFSIYKKKQYDLWAKAAIAQHDSRATAFLFGVLLKLQDLPVEQAHYYTGDSSYFGLFETTGMPRQSWRAFEIFARLLNTNNASNRVSVEYNNKQIAALAMLNHQEITLAISNLSASPQEMQVEIKGVQSYKIKNQQSWDDNTWRVVQLTEEKQASVSLAPTSITLLDLEIENPF